MRIISLHRTLPGCPAFVLGTGPSMRYFPMKALQGAFVVGLNQAWKYHPCKLMLTAHPELYQEWAASEAAKTAPLKWVIKKKAPMADLELADPVHYVYHTSPDLLTVKNQTEDTLYLGEGIQCTAIDLLVRMGAGTVILVGCDMSSVAGEFHGHDQHVRWLGQTPDEQYALYRKTTAQVRSVVRDAFGVSVLTMTPFIGLNGAAEDSHRLRSELNLIPLPKPKDISPYTRKKGK